MITNVTFRHLKSSPALQEAAVDHANKFEKFNDQITSTDIIFENDAAKKVEFTVRVRGKSLVASESSEDFRKSLNTAADKIVRQLKKWKTKRNKNS